MELNEKLSALRKQKGLTQEELAKALYVSRTAVSKWESGRGVPNTESLKAISKYFSVSIDNLLSGEELLAIADKDLRQKETHIRNLVFGVLDCSMIMFLFVPLFGQRAGEDIKGVTLLNLTGAASYIKIPYLIIVFAIIVVGILTLAMNKSQLHIWLKCQYKLSVGLSVVGAVLFIITLQPYAAFITFVFLAIKALMLIKWR